MVESVDEVGVRPEAEAEDVVRMWSFWGGGGVDDCCWDWVAVGRGDGEREWRRKRENSEVSGSGELGAEPVPEGEGKGRVEDVVEREKVGGDIV